MGLINKNQKSASHAVRIELPAFTRTVLQGFCIKRVKITVTNLPKLSNVSQRFSSIEDLLGNTFEGLGRRLSGITFLFPHPLPRED